MTKNRRELPLHEGVEIVSMAAEGKSIAKVDGLTVFVPFAVPDDVVDIQTYRKKNKFAEGRIVRFIEYSKDRVSPVCEHFGVCGGCKWQMLPYPLQLKNKQQQIEDNLT